MRKHGKFVTQVGGAAIVVRRVTAVCVASIAVADRNGIGIEAIRDVAADSRCELGPMRFRQPNAQVQRTRGWVRRFAGSSIVSGEHRPVTNAPMYTATHSRHGGTGSLRHNRSRHCTSSHSSLSRPSAAANDNEMTSNCCSSCIDCHPCAETQVRNQNVALYFGRHLAGDAHSSTASFGAWTHIPTLNSTISDEPVWVSDDDCEVFLSREGTQSNVEDGIFVARRPL